MKLITNGKTYESISFSPSEDGCTIRADEDITVGDTLTVTSDEGAELRTYTVADWLRCEVGGGRLVLSNTPVPVPDLDAQRAGTLRALSAAGNAAIIAGCDVALPSGSIGHFSLQDTDQINLSAAVAAVEQGAAGYPYHADGQLCRLFPAADILAVAGAATAHKLHHTTYCNHLLTWARRAGSVDELGSIIYGAALPADLAENMQEVLGGAQNNAVT